MKKFARWVGWSVGVQIWITENLWASGGGDGGGFPIDVVWQIIAFAVLLFLLAKMLKKPLGSFLVKRQEEIRSTLEKASQKESEAQRLLGEWEEKLESLSREIQDLHETIRREGEEERKRIVDRAEEEGERVEKQARVIAEHEVKKAQMALKKEMVDLSLELAEKLLKEAIQPQDQERLVREYIGKMKEIR